jgi:methylmalonyl-CoA mutase cobalamin-binding domain/chain
VLGAPEGDMHEIGKDIVKTILSGNGYDIVDLGTDVNSLTFIKTAQKEQADIIAISTLMTTTMPGATEVIQLLKDQGIRDDFKVIVGGAPTSKEWAEEVGTDGWAEDAFGALNLINGLMKK